MRVFTAEFCGMKYRYGSTLTLLALLMSACGGGGSGDNGETNDAGLTAVAPGQARTQMQGHVIIEERSGRYHLDAWFANELQTTSPTRELLHDVNGDTCELISDALQPTASSTHRLSAGDDVVIASRTETWATLSRQNGLSSPVYASETRSIRKVWPDDAVLEIEGDDFPAVPATALATLLPLVVTAPADNRNIPQDGILQWEASSDARDKIELVLRSESFGGTQAPRHSVLCELNDDGDFNVPASVLAEADWIVRAARTRNTIVSAGDAQLRIAQISER